MSVEKKAIFILGCTIILIKVTVSLHLFTDVMLRPGMMFYSLYCKQITHSSSEQLGGIYSSILCLLCTIVEGQAFVLLC